VATHGGMVYMYKSRAQGAGYTAVLSLVHSTLTCAKLTQLHDALLVTRVSVTKLIGCSSRTGVRFSSSAVTPLGLVTHIVNCFSAWTSRPSPTHWLYRVTDTAAKLGRLVLSTCSGIGLFTLESANCSWVQLICCESKVK